MPAPHPRSANELALAPVLIAVERNLSRLRESPDLEFAFSLELNDDGRWYRTAAKRAERVRQVATRDVPLHGWHVQPTADLQGLAVEHGGYRVSVMLGKRLAGYVERGSTPATAGAAAS